MDIFALSFLGSVGGVWFALFLLLFVGFGIFSSEIDSFSAGLVTFVVGLVGMDLLFGVPVWEQIVSNPLVVLLFLALYFVAGSAYAVLWRWRRFIYSNNDRIERSFYAWKKTQANTGNTTDFESFLESNDYPFIASNHQSQIAAWVMLWPFGLLWDLMHRPARWIYDICYHMLGALLNRVSKNVARSIHGKNK
jgi:hypothetical protein